MQKQEIDHLFTYHAPGLENLARFDAIREAGKYFALVLSNNTPNGPDQSAAIRKVREAVMTANAAIACHQPGPSNQVLRAGVGAGEDSNKAESGYPPRHVMLQQLSELREIVAHQDKQLADYQAQLQAR